MDPNGSIAAAPDVGRILALAVPSVTILALLVAHSLFALPRRRAIAFWVGAAAYGVLRGVGVRLVTEHALGASFPYVVRAPLFSIHGVSMQEVAGWAIVLYLAWWSGHAFARSVLGDDEPRLFPQVAWACLFLGAVSWAIESTAVTVGWWYWTLPVERGIFGDVPVIGLVDWFFAGIDFLLPFLLLTSAPARGWTRFLAIGAFPLHFAAHAFPARGIDSLPVSPFDAVHWLLLAAILWLALRSPVRDRAFEIHGSPRFAAILPRVAVGILVLDLIMIQTVGLRRGDLVVSLVPLGIAWILAERPLWGAALGALGVALSWANPPLLLAATPVAVAALLRFGSISRRWGAPVAVAALAAMAVMVHTTGAKRERELIRGLDTALASRDRGDLEGALAQLRRLARDHPGSHAPPAFAGEIEYRLERLAEAREHFLSAVRVKQDFVRGYRFLAVIDLRRGESASARTWAEKGLGIDPLDPELRYLDARARALPPEAVPGLLLSEETGPEGASRLAALAFELGDAPGSAAVLERALRLWPGRGDLYDRRIALALAGGDLDTARRFLASWLESSPGDPRARQLADRLGVP